MPIHGIDSLKARLESIQTEYNELFRAKFYNTLKNIQLKTPVDTGQTRNNWFLTVGAKSISYTDATSGNTLSISKIPQNVMSKTIYYTNNTASIESLEYGLYPNPAKQGTWNKSTGKYEIHTRSGYSDQAVGGWVRAEMLKLRKALRQ